MKRIRSTNVKTILKGALAKVQRGWTQYRMYRSGPKPQYCAVGAIHSCTPGGISGYSDSAVDAERIFRKTNNMMSITAWNDDSSRKKSEVVAAFKKAIKSLK